VAHTKQVSVHAGVLIGPGKAPSLFAPVYAAEEFCSNNGVTEDDRGSSG
jgi:hypothetical protein